MYSTGLESVATVLKNGNFNSRHRRKLIDKLLIGLPANEIKAILMDFEFCGEKWLEWLDKHDVAYVLRMKHNTIVVIQLAHKYKRKAKDYFDLWDRDFFRWKR